MITYITAFIFYTLAMIGILLIGFIVYKKTFIVNKNENKGSMKILDSLQIAPKKQLLVVRIRNEKFLIASGVEHTTFLAKLQDDNQNSKNNLKDTSQKQQAKALSQNNETMFMTPEENCSFNFNSLTQKAHENKFDEMYAAQQAQRHYDEMQQARLDKIQRQFKQLYDGNNDFTVQEKEKPLTRKAMVRQLLKDLNDTTSAKAGNGF